MSQVITFNNTSYTVPDTGDVNWGTNVTDYLVAIASGTVQLSGGTFSLTADVDFGASFGLKSLYYKSRSSNLSTTGIVRLANNSDSISWRNAAHNADLALLVNGSNQLTFNGTAITVGGVSSITGTANQVIASAATGAVTLSTPQDIGTASTVTFGNIIDSGLTASTVPYSNASKQFTSSAVTPTELGYVSGVTSAIQNQLNGKQATLTLPLTVANGGSGDASHTAYAVLCGGTTSTAAVQSVSGVGTSGQVLTSNGASALPTWQPVSGSGTVNSGTAQQIAYYATTGTAVSGSSILNLVGTALDLTGTNAVVAINTGDTTTAKLLLQTSAVLTTIETANTGNFDITDTTNSTVALQYTASNKSVAIHGTNTNNSASAGFVGEYIESVISGVAVASSGNFGDLTSISLTAGDWDVSTCVYYTTGTGYTVWQLGISTTTGNSTTGLVLGSNRVVDDATSGVSLQKSQSIPSYRMSLSATTTVYMKASNTYSGGAPTGTGRLSARRRC